jgi:hypothetical protein
MDKKEIILISVLMTFAAFNIYRKYFRKNKNNQGQSEPGSRDPGSSSYDDDYEPYSGK